VVVCWSVFSAPPHISRISGAMSVIFAPDALLLRSVRRTGRRSRSRNSCSLYLNCPIEPIGVWIIQWNSSGFCENRSLLRLHSKLVQWQRIECRIAVQSHFLSTQYSLVVQWTCSQKGWSRLVAQTENFRKPQDFRIIMVTSYRGSGGYFFFLATIQQRFFCTAAYEKVVRVKLIRQPNYVRWEHEIDSNFGVYSPVLGRNLGSHCESRQ